jgi:hypothetical protein
MKKLNLWKSNWMKELLTKKKKKVYTAGFQEIGAKVG